MRRIAAVVFRPGRVVPKYWWAGGIGAFAIALLALVTSPASRDAVAQAQCPFTIDFAGLPHGTILAEQYASQGVHISAVGNGSGADALIVFDTNRAPTHDPDLAIDIGNIALMALNTTDVTGPNGLGPPDGLVDDPDENNVGGTATFTFDHEVSIGSIKWIDKDHVANNFVIAYNAAGDVIVSVPVPLGANSSVQTIAINADGVRRLVFDYDESGGFTGIEVDCAQATPTPTAQADTPTPTEPAPTPTPTAAPTPTPSPAPATPTPPIATSTQAAPAPSPTVAAAVAPPRTADTSVSAGPDALPAGGGTPSARDLWSQWAPLLLLLALISGTTFVSMRGKSR
jgi:hypothetical protein